MTWDDVRIFLAVARAGSIARAAKPLGLDAATVSRRLAALERSLGDALVRRTREGVTLTEAGERVRVRAEEAERPLLALTRPASETSVVRLATSGILSSVLLAPHVPTFRAAHPSFVLEISVARKLVELTRGDADVALRIRPAGSDVAEPSVVALKLADVGFAFYGAGPLIGYLGYDPGRAHVAEDAVVKVDDIPTALALMRAGVGRAVLPCFIGDREPGLARTSGVLEHHRLFVAAHAELRSTARVEAVFAWLRTVADTERERLAG